MTAIFVVTEKWPRLTK